MASWTNATSVMEVAQLLAHAIAMVMSRIARECVAVMLSWVAKGRVPMMPQSSTNVKCVVELVSRRAGAIALVTWRTAWGYAVVLHMWIFAVCAKEVVCRKVHVTVRVIPWTARVLAAGVSLETAKTYAAVPRRLTSAKSVAGSASTFLIAIAQETKWIAPESVVVLLWLTLVMFAMVMTVHVWVANMITPNMVLRPAMLRGQLGLLAPLWKRTTSGIAHGARARATITGSLAVLIRMHVTTTRLLLLMTALVTTRFSRTMIATTIV